MQLFSKGGTLRSPELHKKKQKEKWARIILSILGFLIILALPIFVLRLDQFQIKNVQIKGNNVTKYEDVAKIVGDDLSGNYLFIIPKSNALIYPKDRILKDIQTRIPRIESIEGEIQQPHTLAITITERQPEGLYCNNSGSQKEECYFLDDKGFIFSRAPSFSGEVYFVYLKDPQIEDPLSQSYLPEEEFAKLPPFIKSIKEIGINPINILSGANEYTLALPGGGKIILSKEDDLKMAVNNLDTFLHDKNLSRTPNFIENVQYIDLRFGNKVFYKLKGE